MKTYLLSILLVALGTITNAQTWDAGGDLTSWDDPLNWDNDLVPAAGDIVTFSTGGTVTLTTGSPVTAFPSRVLVATGTNLDINLDLTIGNGAIAEHGLKGQANTTITIKAGNTITINVPTNKEGIQNNATSGAVVNIEAGATVDIIQARDGIQNTAGNFVFVNGTLTITGAAKDGISSQGSLTNSGSITVDAADEDGIDISAGTFTNDGTVTVNRNTGTAGGVYAVDVNGTGTLTNNTVMTLDGSTTTNSNAIALGVLTGATMTNNGSVTLSNGNSARTFFVDGTLNNTKGAIMDLTDRRARVNNGAFTNDGLVLSTFSMAGIFISGTGTAVNNAFYDFGGSAWSTPGTDNGIDLADPADLAIDLADGCVVDIAEVACSWDYTATTGASNFMTDMTGNADLTGLDFAADPSTISLDDYPTYGTIEIELSNICAQALPIELVKFEVSAAGARDIELQWTTASEINSDYIQIERSLNARDWTVIDVVKAQGYSKALVDYDYLDTRALSGVNYYRLRLVDLDGQYEYSAIRQLERKADFGDVQVYPTLLSSGQYLNIDLERTTDNVQVLATQTNGTSVPLATNTTGKSMTIDVSTLYSGLYVLSVIVGDHIHTSKIMIVD